LKQDIRNNQIKLHHQFQHSLSLGQCSEVHAEAERPSAEGHRNLITALTYWPMQMQMT